MPIRLNFSIQSPMRVPSRQKPPKRVPHLWHSFIVPKVGYFVSTAFYSFLLLFALNQPPRLNAQTKRPMTFEDMMQMRRLGSTDVSPDGKWLLYSVTDVDLAKNTRPHFQREFGQIVRE